MLLEENNFLDQQIYNYMKKTDLMQQQINLISEQRDLFKDVATTQNMQLEKLKKELNKKNNTIKGLTIGGVGVTVGLILFLIFK